MLLLLLRAIDHVSRSAAAARRSPYADEIDLWVTATDLTGRTQSVRTADQHTLGVVRETNHRMTFHFLYDAKSDPSDPTNLFAATTPCWPSRHGARRRSRRSNPFNSPTSKA
jgi:hypothetical protein